ncbi:MAG: DUF169 domain-containing protein [Oscillospiraceae bacterium]|nr:DUF169 domain-containing protein [Oscillospiraceae bacterium]
MNNPQMSRALHEMLILRHEPIAVKLIKSEDEIPDHAICPRRDLKKHMALCQAFAMARRDKKTVYMDKLDHWCWNPLIGLGHVECIEGTDSFDVVCRFLGMSDMDAARGFFAKFPRLPFGEHTGIVSAPLETAEFTPDLLLIYCNNAQLRSLVWAAKLKMGRLVETQLDAIDSCIYACVPPILTGEYRVTLPDIGEYERAMADEDEIIFSVPGARIDELLDGLRSFYDRGAGYAHHQRDMVYDFPRPEFYNELFDMWGLDKGEVWDR